MSQRCLARRIVPMMAAAALAACSGKGDDGSGDPPPPPVLPQLSIGSAVVAEGNSGNTELVLTATLSGAASSNVTAAFATADGTATAGGDYTARSGTLTDRGRINECEHHCVHQR